MAGTKNKIFRAIVAAACLFSVGSQISATAAAVDNGACFRDIKLTPITLDPTDALRADACEAAEILRITPIVKELHAAQATGSSAGLSRHTQSLRLICLWKILRASEDVRAMVGQIDFDLAVANVQMGALAAKQNKIINTINTFNFLQGGTLGTIKQSMGLEHAHPTARQVIAITSFGGGTVLSVVNLLVPMFVFEHNDGRSNALAAVLGDKYVLPGGENNYLWKFLQAPVPGSSEKLTRREVLVKHWQVFGGMADTPPSRIRLAGGPEDQYLEHVGVLNRRISLLHDLKTHVEEFEGALLSLHQEITL